MKILLLEDDYRLASALRKSFEKQNWEVAMCYTIQQALIEMRKNIDLFCLDLKLPDGDAFATCKEIRSFSDRPILIISADYSQQTLLRSYECQVDDYIVKPFHLNVLLLKVRMLLERTSQYGNVIESPHYRLDRTAQVLYCPDQEISLSVADCSLLTALMSNNCHIVSREQLCMALQTKNDASLSVRICNLRKKLPDPTLIQGQRKGGYLWNDES